jgi:hypothetical protein
MPELFTQKKSVYWKRTLIGGLLSSAFASACFGFFIYNAQFVVRGIFFFLLLGFGYPGILLNGYASNIILVLAAAVFWFMIGALISRLARRNIVAIGIWLIAYAISTLLSLAWFAEINN